MQKLALVVPRLGKARAVQDHAGRPAEPPAHRRQFVIERVVLGRDGLLYVCDRQNDRLQVFTKTGVLVRVIPVIPGTGATPGPGRGLVRKIQPGFEFSYVRPVNE